MTKSDFYYDSRDDISQIHAVKWMPDTDPVGILLVVHGMAEHLGRYDAFAEYMCDRGFIVVGNEHLGHGGSIGKNPKGYFCRRDPATVVVRDVHRLKKTIQGEYPSLPIFIFGHSMGSMITRNYLTKYGSGINGAILCGTLMMPKATIKALGALVSISKMILGAKHPGTFIDKIAFGSYCKKIENPRTPFDWLSRDVDVVNKYIADPNCGFIFTVNGFQTLKDLMLRLHNEKLLAEIPKDLPVFFIYGQEDPCGDYGVSVKQVYEQYVALGIKDVTEHGYEEARHELLQETNREEVMEDVYDWIKSKM